MEKDKQISDNIGCPYCNSPVKDKGCSLHCWHTEYECGHRIWGAIDTETHGDGAVVENMCGEQKSKITKILNKE